MFIITIIHEIAPIFREEADLFLQELVELGLAVGEAAPVGRVDDPDEPVGRLEVVPPVRPQRLLPAHVPNVQVEALRGPSHHWVRGVGPMYPGNGMLYHFNSAVVQHGILPLN